MSVLKTNNITRNYKDGDNTIHALNHLNLEVEEGEFTAIVGPSGSGKTTLLNIIGGLDKPNEGDVFIGDTEITTMKDNELIDFRLWNIGFVFQAYNLIPVLTAKENIEFIMLLQKKGKKEREKRAIELLKEVGLEKRINARPSELSGGQQQRVAVARALATKPKFVLADEPTANLDSHSTETLIDIMLRLNKEENITFIFATHDQRVIKRARRVVTMLDGCIISDERN